MQAKMFIFDTGLMKLLNELQDILVTCLTCDSERDLTGALAEPISRPVSKPYTHVQQHTHNFFVIQSSQTCAVRMHVS